MHSFLNKGEKLTWKINQTSSIKNIFKSYSQRSGHLWVLGKKYNWVM